MIFYRKIHKTVIFSNFWLLYFLKTIFIVFKMYFYIYVVIFMFLRESEAEKQKCFKIHPERHLNNIIDTTKCLILFIIILCVFVILTNIV